MGRSLYYINDMQAKMYVFTLVAIKQLFEKKSITVFEIESQGLEIHLGYRLKEKRKSNEQYKIKIIYQISIIFYKRIHGKQ